MLRIWSTPICFLLLLPILQFFHHCHCVAEHGFWLCMCMCMCSTTEAESVFHEGLPQLPRDVFPRVLALSLGFEVRPRSPRLEPPFQHQGNSFISLSPQSRLPEVIAKTYWPPLSRRAVMPPGVQRADSRQGAQEPTGNMPP